MSVKHFFMDINDKEPKPDIHLFFVFDNAVSIVHFNEDDPDVFFLGDERLDDKKLWIPPSDFYHMFLDDLNEAGREGKRIIVIRYNPMVAQCARELFKEFERREKRIQWHALAFFHNDEDTKSLGLHWSDVITAKVYTIDSMNNFPVIKKIEVPPHASFFHRDLLQLVLDEDEFKKLDDEDEVPYDRLDNDKPPQLRWKVNRS